jgi:hypothetical protein
MQLIKSSNSLNIYFFYIYGPEMYEDVFGKPCGHHLSQCDEQVGVGKNDGNLLQLRN